jgi:2-oxo-4-hydroxy-4-carboxy-5-ureidoimidazoline decarboxylase
MEKARPFADGKSMAETADRIWRDLKPADWLEAFSRHPKIGEKSAIGWAGQEQSGARGASAGTMDQLAEHNHAYEARFGYIFIICATGKNAEEMLEILRKRLKNDPETELRLAAEEQRRITQLRLDKLLQ